MSVFFIPALFISQNVGINTAEPSRKLDVNGNLKVSSIPVKTGNVDYSRILHSDKTSGKIDYILISDIFKAPNNNSDVQRKIYLADTPVTANECTCSDLTFRINNNNTAEFKLNSNTIFTTNNNATQFVMGYGIKRWSNNSPEYTYQNGSTTFTSTNYNTYQTLDATLFPSSTDNTIRIYTIVPPNQKTLYRVTLTKNTNNDSGTNKYLYGIICERFSMQSL